MARKSRVGSIAAAIAVTGALLLPAAGASAAPTAQKSGAIVNYTTTGKLKIAKKIVRPVRLLGELRRRLDAQDQGPLREGLGHRAGIPAGRCGGGSLHQAERAAEEADEGQPRRYKLVSHVTATDPATGAVDKISHAFKLKR